MMQSDPIGPSSRSPLLKVWYLVGIGVAAFAAPQASIAAFGAGTAAGHIAIGALLLLQLLLLAYFRVGPAAIGRAVYRLRWLFVFFLAIPPLPGLFKGSSADALSGLLAGLLMTMQMATLLWASLLVQSTGSPTDLVDGLRRLRLPELFVYSIDNTLAVIGPVQRRGGGGGRKRRRNGGKQSNAANAAAGSALGESAEQLSDLEKSGDGTGEQPGFWAIMRRLLRGDIGFLVRAVQSGHAQARAQLEATDAQALQGRLRHDVEVISGVAVLMMSIKILKLLPGVAFASGFKTVLLIPLYILATQRTFSRWGGTVAGSIMGIIALLMTGDAAYGVFEIPKHIAAGLAVDLLWPIARVLPGKRFVYCLLGLAASAFWVTMDPKVAGIWLPALSTGQLWTNPAVLLPIVPKVLFTLFFGATSGLVSYYAMDAFGDMDVTESEPTDGPPTRPVQSTPSLSDVRAASGVGSGQGGD